MEARVKDTCKWRVVSAFAGREYIKSEWREVPNSARKQAELHPFLDVRVDGVELAEPDEVKAVEVVTAVPIKKPVSKRKPRPRRKPAPKKAVTDD